MKLVDRLEELQPNEPESDGLSDIVIRSFHPIAEISGMGKVEIEAAETLSPGLEAAFHFIRFTVYGGGEYERQEIAAVSFANVQRLVNAIEKLANVKITTDRFSSSEVTAKIEDLTITAFNGQRGQVHVSISVGSTSCFLNSQSQLEDVLTATTRARDHILRISK